MVLALFDQILEEYSFGYLIPVIGQWYQFYWKFPLNKYININTIQKIKKEIKITFIHNIDENHNQKTALIVRPY